MPKKKGSAVGQLAPAAVERTHEESIADVIIQLKAAREKLGDQLRTFDAVIGVANPTAGAEALGTLHEATFALSEAGFAFSKVGVRFAAARLREMGVE